MFSCAQWDDHHQSHHTKREIEVATPILHKRTRLDNREGEKQREREILHQRQKMSAEDEDDVSVASSDDEGDEEKKAEDEDDALVTDLSDSDVKKTLDEKPDGSGVQMTAVGQERSDAAS